MLSKEQIIYRIHNMQRKTDILNGFEYLGPIEVVYPQVLRFIRYTHTIHIWEWYNKEFRVAIIQKSERDFNFLCEATPANLIEHLSREKVEVKI